MSSKDNDICNENPNPFLTSGFTFVGQFVDHDITFDTTPLSEQQSDPDATTNFRTPRYDLDAIYGRGPQPQTQQFYDPRDRDKFRIDRTTTATSPATHIGDRYARRHDGVNRRGLRRAERSATARPSSPTPATTRP